MNKKQRTPSIKETAFNCPHCGVYTTQYWSNLHARRITRDPKVPLIPGPDELKDILADVSVAAETKKRIKGHFQQLLSGEPFPDRAAATQYEVRDLFNMWITECYDCKRIAIWVSDHLIYPPTRGGDEPNEELPDDVRHDYEEARSILNLSPRGGAALLRLCVQKLCIHLGGAGKKLDDDIAALVARGLNPVVQKSLDIVRVIGNEAVHPGVLDLKDDRDTASRLFQLVNAIAEQMISHPKNVDELYAALPESKREAIAKRDGKK